MCLGGKFSNRTWRAEVLGLKLPRVSVDNAVIAPSGSSSHDGMSGVDGVSVSSPSPRCNKLLWSHNSQAEPGSCPASLQREGTARVPGVYLADLTQPRTRESGTDCSDSVCVYFQIMLQTADSV